jgi:hypothetical protein
MRKLACKGERFLLVHGFNSFSSWLLGPVDFGPVASQYMMAEVCGGWEAERMTGKS